MNIMFFSAQPYDQHSFDAALDIRTDNSNITVSYQGSALNQHTVALAQNSDAICVFVNDTVDETVLNKLKEYGVNAVLLRCAGYNNVDIAAATRLGIFVARVPAYSPEAVAEHTLALTMTLNRHIHRAYNRVRDGNFMLEGLLGKTLHGKTVGIIGTGRIGVATARIFNGMGCHVIGHDPYMNDAFAQVGTYVDYDQLLQGSDIISLHCPLTDSSYHQINQQALDSMKPGTILVNTSRGALIDTYAAINALKSGQLGALAIDVYEREEPLFFKDRSEGYIDDDQFVRLMSFPNVLVTGHQGFFTEEALHEIAQTTLNNLDDFIAGRSCANALTH